jgi:hypothetical protein
MTLYPFTGERWQAAVGFEVEGEGAEPVAAFGPRVRKLSI